MSTSGGGDWTQVAIAVVAAYAAIIATLSLYLGWRGGRRRLKVTLSYGIYGSPGSWASPTQLVYSAANTGSTSVRVNSVALLLPNGRKLIPTNYQGGPVPNTILPGHSLDIYEDVSQVEVALRREGLTGKLRVKAAFNDATGKIYRSKATTLEV